MAEIRLLGIDTTTGRKVMASTGDTTIPVGGTGSPTEPPEFINGGTPDSVDGEVVINGGTP